MAIKITSNKAVPNYTHIVWYATSTHFPYGGVRAGIFNTRLSAILSTLSSGGILAGIIKPYSLSGYGEQGTLDYFHTWSNADNDAGINLLSSEWPTNQMSEFIGVGLFNEKLGFILNGSFNGSATGEGYCWHEVARVSRLVKSTHSSPTADCLNGSQITPAVGLIDANGSDNWKFNLFTEAYTLAAAGGIVYGNGVYLPMVATISSPRDAVNTEILKAGKLDTATTNNVYSAIEDAWVTETAYGYTRQYSCSYNSYVLGGLGAASAFNDMSYYSLVTHAWGSYGTFTTGVYNAASSAITWGPPNSNVETERYGYITGGQQYGGTRVTTALKLYPTSVSSIASLPSAVAEHSMVSGQGTVTVMGGRDGSLSAKNTVWTYNPNYNTWLVQPTLAKTSYGNNALTLGTLRF